MIDSKTAKELNLEIDHINGCKLDNRLCNLELVSRKENVRRGIENNLIYQSVKNNFRSKPVYQISNETGNITYYHSYRDIERVSNYNRACVRKVINICKTYRNSYWIDLEKVPTSNITITTQNGKINISKIW